MLKRDNLFVFVVFSIFILLIVYLWHSAPTELNKDAITIVTAGVSVVTLIYTQSNNTQKEIDSRQFAKKADAYQEIIQIIFDMMKSAESGNDDGDEDVKRLRAMMPKLVVWGGIDVLNAWMGLMQAPNDQRSTLLAGNRLMVSLRKELGHSRDAVLGPLGIINVILDAEERLENADLIPPPQ